MYLLNRSKKHPYWFIGLWLALLSRMWHGIDPVIAQPVASTLRQTQPETITVIVYELNETGHPNCIPQSDCLCTLIYREGLCANLVSATGDFNTTLGVINYHGDGRWEIDLEAYTRDVLAKELGYQDSNIIEAQKAVAVAIRHFARFRYKNIGNLNNSTNAQVYIPGLSAGRADIAQAVADTAGVELKYTLTPLYWGSDVHGAYSRDHSAAMTAPGDYPYLKAIYDPEGRGGGTGIGLSQLGACRWAAGNADTNLDDYRWDTGPRPQWDHYAQILAHYYTGIDITYADGTQASEYRWNAIAVSDIPATMDPGQEVSIFVLPQNTGTKDWPADEVRLTYWWEGPTGIHYPDSDDMLADTVAVGELAMGEVPKNTNGEPSSLELTIKLPVNIVSGEYQLHLDMASNGMDFSRMTTAMTTAWFVHSHIVSAINVPDADNDGLSDALECPQMPCPDTDADGLPDYKDLDSDQDSILDAVEIICTVGNSFDDSIVPCNSDKYAPESAIADNIPDYLDLDSDGDGVFDLIEAGDQDLTTPPHANFELGGDGFPHFRNPHLRSIPYDSSLWDTIDACNPTESPSFHQGTACGLAMLRATLEQAGIDITADDPPVPGLLFATTPVPLRAGSAQTTLTATATHTPAPLHTTLNTAHTTLSGDLHATWATDSWLSTHFLTLTVPHAQVYRISGSADQRISETLLAEGAIVAHPHATTAVALALGDILTYTISGTGAASFYAPATAGLGVGGTWHTYNAQVTPALLAGTPITYGVGVHGATLTVNGLPLPAAAYSGTLVLVTTDALSLAGNGQTLAPNFTAQVALAADNATVHIGESRIANGESSVVYAGFTGALTITEATADLDRVTLVGTYTRDMRVHTAPAHSIGTPLETFTFQTVIQTTQDDAYTLTVAPPTGWAATVDAAGIATLTPARAAAPGTYTARVIAQSASTPALWATTVHTITLQPYAGMAVTLAPDPLTTVPWGPVADPEAGSSTNSGQAQIPGAAYIATLTNTSTVPHTFRVNIVPESFPSEWIALGGAGRTTSTTLTLAAGGVGRLGVYISPEGLNVLPPAGTHYPFTLHAAAADVALAHSASVTFTMPPVPFSYLQARPEVLLATADVAATFEVTVHNVGNVSGTLDVWAVPPTTWVVGAPYSVSLAAGAADMRPYIFIPAGAKPGDEGTIRVQSPAPGSPYVQGASVLVRIVGPCTLKAAHAAQSAHALADLALATALDDLTLQLGRWEQDPGNTWLQERTATAQTHLSARLHPAYPALDTTALDTASTVDDFCAPLTAIAQYLDALVQAGLRARLTPGVTAALAGERVTVTLQLRNQGVLTQTYHTALRVTNYELRVTGSEPAIVQPDTTSSFTLAPGATHTVPVVLLPQDLGWYTLHAEITAADYPTVQVSASAGVRVVDRLVQVLSVATEPPFIEVGPNTAQLYAHVANIVGVPQNGWAYVTVQAPAGHVVATRTVPVQLTAGLTPQRLDLGPVDTTAWPAGYYTLTLSLLDTQGHLIPAGRGTGYLGVGQALHATHAVSPTLVPPGTVTVTTIITTETAPPLDQQGAAPTAPDVALSPQPSAPRSYANYLDRPKHPQHPTDSFLSKFVVVSSRPPGLASLLRQSGGGLERLENDAPTLTYTGTWSARSIERASAGNTQRSRTLNDRATLTVTGTWLSVGFVAGRSTGMAEVFIDGVNQGSVDLRYNFADTQVAFHYTDLGPGPHVLRLRNVTDTRLDALDTTGTPFSGTPMVEWSATEPAGGLYGVMSTAAAGDLAGDGRPGRCAGGGCGA